MVVLCCSRIKARPALGSNSAGKVFPLNLTCARFAEKPSGSAKDKVRKLKRPNLMATRQFNFPEVAFCEKVPHPSAVVKAA
jgi:hypothetical protein